MKMELIFLRRKIEWFRQKMIQTAASKGSLVDQEVIEVSQILDKLLVEYQKLKLQIAV